MRRATGAADGGTHEGSEAAGGPGVLQRVAVRAAVLVVPRGKARDRYREEFLAELWAVPPSRRARHLLGVLVHVIPLGLAVRQAQENRWRDLVGPRPRRPWLCRLGRHRWATFSTEDGGRYKACSRCGKDFTVRDGTTGSAITDGKMTWLGF